LGYWKQLSLNENAIDILERNLEKIDWYNLSINENSISIFENHKDKINWLNLSIFELDYEKMKENNQGMYEDLIKEVMKPSRVFKNPEYDYLEINRLDNHK
jgi:hypothetical protein